VEPRDAIGQRFSSGDGAGGHCPSWGLRFLADAHITHIARSLRCSPAPWPRHVITATLWTDGVVTVVVLLGAPGAGKGTQAPALAEHLGVPVLASGDLLRAAVVADTPLGRAADQYMSRGELVPDSTIVDIFLDRLSQADAAGGAILDGFPRTRAQAAALDRALAERGSHVDRALYIDVPVEDLVQRMASRRICAANGHVYNLISAPPERPGTCDIDGSELVQRDDDREETVRARMAKQLPPLEEVVDHYRASSVLRTVDGRRPIDEVTTQLIASLEPSAHGAGSMR
jgi:adenylate kinase